MDDPRLDCAILRPMEADGDHFLAYYLTKEDEAALEFKQGRMARLPGEASPEGDESTYFHFVRDYETVKVEQEVPNEFLLVLDEGTDEFETDLRGGAPRPKGAYYKNIERKMLLKKKRVNVRAVFVLLGACRADGTCPDVRVIRRQMGRREAHAHADEQGGRAGARGGACRGQ